MRIRKRSVTLPFSMLSPSTTTTITSDPPLKANHYEQAKKLHPSVSDDDDDDLSLKSKTHSHNQPSGSVNQCIKLEDQVPSGSSDLQLALIREKNGWICGSDGVSNDKEDDEYWCMNDTKQDQMEMEMKNKKTLQGGLEGEEEEEEEMKIRRGNEDKKKKNNRSNNMISGRLGASAAEVVVSAGSLSFNISSTDHHQQQHHHQVKKKKIRGRLFDHERKQQEVGEVYYDDDHAMMIMKKDNKKSNANKKWVHEKDQEKEDISSTTAEKKVKRENGQRSGGGGVMEGSRCSRVNGRGWRCCQQTLVGYSLCEHHLGKGRIRSMSSVRRTDTKRKMNINKEDRGKNSVLSLSKLSEAQEQVLDDDKEEEVDKKKGMMAEKPSSKKMMNNNIKRPKKKIGMVKARSISSLLGQTQQYYGTASCCSSS